MSEMNKLDHWDLDGRLLRLLVAVIETGSVTRAAERLSLTQSAVSHGLDRLRAIVGDPLFVRSGRGIAPTARAVALGDQARELLEGLTRFARPQAFDPSALELLVGVAANPLQRDLLLPRYLMRLRQTAPRVRLRVLPSDVPSSELLRDETCHLVLSPRPPEVADVMQRRLFEDGYRVFYDPLHRSPPADRATYEAAEHVSVMYETGKSLEIDRVLHAQGVERRLVAQVADFSGVRPFMIGTDRLATLPGLLRHGQLRGLSDAPVPVSCPSMPMFLLWHLRHQDDPVHQWLREELLAVVPQAMGEAMLDD